MAEPASTTPQHPTGPLIDPDRRLVTLIQRRAPADAADLLAHESDAAVARALEQINPTLALKILLRMPEERRARVVPAVTGDIGSQWTRNQRCPEDSVGRLMEPAVAVFGMGTTVRQAIDRIRELMREHVFTYAFVVDDEERLQGVVVMRDLLFAEGDDLLIDIMVPQPFYFHPDTSVCEAMHAVLHRHYPSYPVCDQDGRLLGIVQGYMLFEEHAFEMSAQSGRMVGVEKDERVTTPWWASFRSRHPWLQLNLLTAFTAAAVVSRFEDTIDQLVVLAAFLPVLAGQSGNTGSQALAVTVRGLTLGDFTAGLWRRVLVKEAWLGLLNGFLVGLVAAGAMYYYAMQSDAREPLVLAFVVLLAMTFSCVCSGVTGVLVPLSLRRIGVDPATASSIFLTTATDVTSMGLFLGLASLLVL